MFNVLIVEDDKNIRKLMEINLKNDGYNVDTANDGLDAVDKVGKSHYDILIVDAMMPKMNGYEFLTEIKNLNMNIPSIMVTAKGDIEDKAKGFDVGVDEFGDSVRINFQYIKEDDNIIIANAKNVFDI